MATTIPSTAPAPGAVDPRRWTALTFIALAQLMVVLDATIVNIALPSAQRALHISDGNRQWVITAYTLAFGGLLLFGGRLADLLGRKRTFLIGLLGFAGSSALGGAAVNSGMLLGARAMQGAFGALLAPSALSMLAVMFTESRERAKAFGVYGAIVGGGSAVGLILGGVLTQYLNWRWALYVNVPIAVVAFVGSTVFVSSTLSKRNPTRLDISGVVLITVGLTSLVYGFTRAESNGWRDGITLLAFGTAVALIIAFVVVEQLIKAPLLPLRVVLNRNRGGAYLAVGLSVIAMFGLFLFLTYYLQTVKDYSPIKTGLAFLPMSAGMIIGSTQISARLMYRVAPRLLMVPGLLVAGAGMGMLTQLRVDSPYTALVLPAQLLLGLGLGVAFMPAMSLATNGVDPKDAGVASAMVNTSQQVGGSIGTALLNTIAATAATNYLKDHAHGRATPQLLADGEVHGFTVAIWWGVAALLLAVALVLLLINARVQHAGAPAARDSQRADAPLETRVAEETAELAVVGARTEPVDAVALAAASAASASSAGSANGFEAAAGTEIRGYVNGSEGVSVSRATLTLIDLNGRQLSRAASGTDGGYALTAPGSGSYVLIAAADGHQPQAATVVVGDQSLSYDLMLASTAGLVGAVRDAVDATPVAGAMVVVTDVRGEVVASAATGEDGTFGLQELVAGLFTLAVNAAGYRPRALAVEVAASGITRCEVELRPGARLLGIIRAGGTRTPLADARVTLVNAAGNVVAATTTQADGAYVFTDLTAGDYTVIASSYPPVATSVTLDGTGESGFDVILAHPEH
jgi:EmrB/QacA subfamily drug resistance transporter